MTATAHERVVEAGTAVDRASRIMLACQHPDGWWPDPAVAGVTFAPEGLLARVFLRTGAEARAASADLIRACQRADGSWAGGEPGAATDVSASVLAYLALRLAGDPPDAYHMAAAAGWIRDAGGVDAIGLPARAWLAMFGLTAWADVPPASGSRVVTVTLAILKTTQPVHPVAVELSELRAGPGVIAFGGWRPPAPLTAARPAALSAARRAAPRRCGNWLAGWLQHGGASETSRPVWPCSVVALHTVGHQASGPAPSASLARLDRSLPPVALSSLAVEGLLDAGLAGDHPALLAAARWLLEHHIDGPAASLAGRSEPVPSGWTFCPDGYPRPADTAVVLLALSRIEFAGLADSPVLSAAARWLAGIQDRDGSWDGSAATTGYCVRALAGAQSHSDAAVRAIRRGVVWLLRAQLASGAWPGVRGGSDLLATTVALPALLAAGVRTGKPAVTGAIGWLLSQQAADGGWHLGDVTGPRSARHSDPAGTARALMALLSVGGAPVTSGTRAAADWLTSAQRPDGSWTTPGLMARGPSGLVGGAVLPLAALGQYVSARQNCRAPTPTCCTLYGQDTDIR